MTESRMFELGPPGDVARVGTRVTFPEISPRAWEHPADRAALTALRKVPALDTMVRKVVALLGDRRLRLLHLSSAVRVSERQFPRVYSIYRESLQILDVRHEPDLFVAQTPIVNAGAVGIDEPFIVLNSGTLDLFDEDELRAVIGHELGHALSYHALYRTMSYVLVNLFLNRFRLGYAAFWAVVAALTEWSRKAELSGDRAGLLCSQDPEVCYRVEMKLAGGAKTDQMSVDAFREQAREFEASGDVLDSVLKLGAVMFRSHPFSVSRLVELERWVESGAYRRILEGEYPRRGEEDEASVFTDAAESVRSYKDAFDSSEDALMKFIQDMQSAGGNAWDRARSVFGAKKS